MKQKIEIELDGIRNERFWIISRSALINGLRTYDPRQAPWWNDNQYICIELPRPEPRFRVATRSGSERWFFVDDTEKGDWVASFDFDLDPDAERHATEFADKLNREKGELS